MRWAASRLPGHPDLPGPQTAGGMSLAEALARRRSCRDFAERPVPAEAISQLAGPPRASRITRKGNAPRRVRSSIHLWSSAGTSAG
jgi:hypothetical protein